MEITDAEIVPATSTEKPVKTLDEINQEYAEVCGKAGDFSFKIACMEQDLVRLYQRMSALNVEAKAAGAKAMPI